jgi:hypothetical protein
MNTPPDVVRLADLSARYARYSLSAGGLSSVFGGALLVITFAAGLLDPPPAVRAALVAAPLLWLACKELLRRAYYQRSSAVGERIDERARRWHLWTTIYLAAVAALVIGGISMKFGAKVLAWPFAGYVLVVASLPFVSWRWFWSIADFLIGVLLMCQSAVVLVGLAYPLPWLFIAGSFALLAITTGWREHRDYLALRRELGVQ